MAIEARRLCKVFGRRVVLRQIDFQVAPGQTVAIMGANGAGKTTLLRCLASLLRPDGGEVHWFGEPARARPAARHLVAMVAHESFLYPHLTLRENLLFAARMHGLSQPARQAQQWLESTGLKLHADRLLLGISRGMRQRLAVARALVHDPPILLLDEPFCGLDAQWSAWLLQLLLKLRNRGRSICLTTHDEPTAARLADRVVCLRSGRLEEQRSGSQPVVAGRPDKARAA